MSTSPDEPVYTEQTEPEPTPTEPATADGWSRHDGAAATSTGGDDVGPTLVDLDAKLNRVLEALGITTTEEAPVA